MLVARIQGKTPQLFGFQILRISSSSMEPKLQVGDIILSKRVKDVTTLKLGDIITYEGEIGGYADKIITHEVALEAYEVNGEYYLRTIGIANEHTDPEISEGQVMGKMVCTIPVFKAIYDFFITPWGLVLILGFLALLFTNELIVLIKLIKNGADEEDSEDDLNDEINERDNADVPEIAEDTVDENVQETDGSETQEVEEAKNQEIESVDEQE